MTELATDGLEERRTFAVTKVSGGGYILAIENGPIIARTTWIEIVNHIAELFSDLPSSIDDGNNDLPRIFRGNVEKIDAHRNESLGS